MHAYTWRELHEVSHRRIDEPSANRRGHIDIGVGHHRPTPAINDSSVDAGNVVQIFIRDAESPGGRQVTGTAGADLGLHDRAIVIKEVSLLFRQIELYGILGQADSRQTGKQQKCESKRSHLAK